MNRPDIDAIETKHLIPVVMGEVVPDDHIAVALAACICWIRELEKAQQTFAEDMKRECEAMMRQHRADGRFSTDGKGVG